MEDNPKHAQLPKEKTTEEVIAYQKRIADRKSQTIPVLNLVLVFIWPPFGAFFAIIIALILLKSKNQNKAITQVGLIFALAIFLLFLLMMLI